MKKVIVFDMDDTLYDEYEFVKSGFQAVADYLAEEYRIDAKAAYNSMWETIQIEGRGSVFDVLLRENNIYSKKLVNKCVSVYRLHKPKIHLPKSSIEILSSLNTFPLYLVTDGNKNTQYNKIKALKLDEFMEKCYITYRYGRHNSKPSPHCFQLIAKREKVEPENIVYIGDNPLKDFVGIKPLGYKTIRIMTGQHANKHVSDDFDANIRIQQISELPTALKLIWPEVEV